MIAAFSIGSDSNTETFAPIHKFTTHVRVKIKVSAVPFNVHKSFYDVSRGIINFYPWNAAQYRKRHHS
jgi:hypothetical protein